MELIGGGKIIDNLRKWGENIPQSGLAIGYFDTTDHYSPGEYPITILQNNNNGTCIIEYIAQYDHIKQRFISQLKKKSFSSSNIRLGYHKKNKYPLNTWVEFKYEDTRGHQESDNIKGMISSIYTYTDESNKLDKTDFYNIIGSELPKSTQYKKISEGTILNTIQSPLKNKFNISQKVQFMTGHQKDQYFTHGTIISYTRNIYGEYIYKINTESSVEHEYEYENNLSLYIPPRVKSAGEIKRETDKSNYDTISSNYERLSLYFKNNSIYIPLFLNTGECLLYFKEKLYILRIGTYINYQTLNGPRLCPIASVDYYNKRIRILYDSISQKTKTEITLYSTNTNNIKNIVDIL